MPAQVDEPGVWTELGHAQLDSGAVNEAISSYLRSGDSSRYKDVIARSQEANAHGDLVKYLLMVRKKVKESKVRCSWDLARRCISYPRKPPNLYIHIFISTSMHLQMCWAAVAQVQSTRSLGFILAKSARWSPASCCTYGACFATVRIAELYPRASVCTELVCDQRLGWQ